MQTVAQAWLVYRLTESSFMLGVVAFCNLAPVLLFSLFGGVIADRIPRQQLLIGAQTAAMVQALVLAVLTLLQWITPGYIIMLALFLGVVHAFEMPARHALLAQLVPRENLPNAIALNSSAFNSARFIGPAVAGWLVTLYGEGVVFLINACSFLAVLAGLVAMRLPVTTEEHSGSAHERLLEGLRFAWNQLHVRAGLIIISVTSLVSASMTVLMPVFAREIFHADARVLGYLLSAIGIGALMGALRLALRTTADGIDRLIGLASITSGVSMIGFSLVDTYWLAMPVLVLAGFSHTTTAASVNTLIQLLVPDRLRGRVMALFSMIFIGLMPVGSLLAGAFGESLGVRATITGAGLLCLAGAAAFLVLVPRLEVFDQQ